MYLFVHTKYLRRQVHFQSLDLKWTCLSIIVSRTTAHAGEMPALFDQKNSNRLHGKCQWWANGWAGSSPPTKHTAAVENANGKSAAVWPLCAHHGRWTAGRWSWCSGFGWPGRVAGCRAGRTPHLFKITRVYFSRERKTSLDSMRHPRPTTIHDTLFTLW